MTSEAASLGPFLTNRFGDRYLYEVNRNTFDQVGAEAIFHKYFGQSLLRENRLYFLIGTDSGLLLQHLLKMELPVGSRYIFIELPRVITALRREGVLEKLSERIAVIEVQDLAEQARVFQFQQYVYLEATELRKSLAAADDHLGGYFELNETSLNWLSQEVFTITANIGVASFMIRQLENLAENILPAKLLKGAFQGKTAVLLAGGPSLDEILPWVKANKDRLVILAVSRISRQLLSEGLFPHFVVSIDPKDINFEVGCEMLHLHQNSILVNANHVSPMLLGQWQGRKLYLGPLFPWETLRNVKNIGISGPTVTNSALALAVEFGCAQVVLAGVDLCFNRYGFTHASGSNESQAGPLLGTTALQVETNEGGRAYTSYDLRSAIDVLNNQAADARSCGCRVINPAPGAARMSNIEYMALETIEVPQPDGKLVSDALSQLPDEDSLSRSEHYQIVIRELSRVEKDLKKLLSLAKEALACNDGLFGRKGKKADYRHKLRMDTIEKRINTELADIALCTRQFGIRRLLKSTRVDQDKHWSNAEIENAGRIYYQAYRDSSRDLIGLIQAALDRLQVRLEEEKPNPEESRLVAQWRKDRQPGRFLVWKKHHLAAMGDIPPGFSTHKKLLEAEFEQLMKNTELAHLKKVSGSRRVVRARIKAKTIFQSNDSSGLRKLLEGLEKHPDRDNALLLNSLIQGYLAELDKKPDQALEAYQTVIGETFTPLVEDALRRIASVCLGQGNMEMALMALECLANAVIIYKPQYAELLRLTGRMQDASDVYTDYLEVIPTDLAVLLKLGQLYRAMGQEHSARQIFQIVLQQEPANKAAQSLLKGN
jgi:tetratricopeptide (TPR) repeat protein